MRQRSLPTRRPQDRGASAIEYAGLIVLAALILGALVAIGIPGKVGAGVERAICTILHEQNCGKQPAASPQSPGKAPSPTTPAGTVPRFGGGILHGLASIAVPPASERDELPIHSASLPINPAAPNPPKKRGGDNSTEHNRVVADTAQKIQLVMGQYVTNGQVTGDCGPGGATANCIPGGHKSGNGENGRADVILRGYDKKTGKPVIYIWEVKPNTEDGRAEAPGQLARYVRQKQKEVGPGTEVRYGFNLPDSYNIPGNGNRVLNAWSDADPDNPDDRNRGVRWYGGHDRGNRQSETQKAPETQTQTQTQQQPADPFCGAKPPIALKAKKECIAIPGWYPNGAPRGNTQPEPQPQTKPQAPAEPDPIAPEPEPVPFEPLVPVP